MQPPREWRFDVAVYEVHTSRGQAWHMPRRLVRSGALANIWARGDGHANCTAISLLPVLALHVWPGKGHPADRPADANWTPWELRTVRELAKLAGVNKDSVTDGLRALARVGLAQTRYVRTHGLKGGPRRLAYRMNTALYRTRGGEPFVPISAKLFYGGLWALLPTPSARLLYLVAAGLDPVYDEEAFTTRLEEDHTPDIDERISNLRERAPMTITTLAAASGMSRAAVQAARRVLCTPGPAGMPAFARRLSSSLTLERAILDRPVPPDVLNDRKEVAALRRAWWPNARRRHAVERP